MIDQASFWLGFIAGVIGFVALGLAVGAISVSVSVDKDGVRTKVRRDDARR